ncbi:Ig-like domain-containing protein [Bacillus tianshenii]|nr:Ig-like domain-containing protein [Bacillus tianshenii]
MRKFQVIVVSMLTLAATMFVLFVTPIHSADFSRWEQQLTENPKKEWKIHFSEPVKPTTVSRGTVYITNSDSEKIRATVKVSADRKSITVKPLVTYKQGEMYRLIIKNGVTSKNADNLTNTVVMPFKYVKAANKSSSSSNPTQSSNKPALKEEGFDIQVKLGDYVNQVTVTANDYVSKVKVNGYELHYLGDNQYKLGLSGLEKGKRLYVQGYNNSGKLVHREYYTIK